MLIGQLARQAGVSTSKIRFYEARALLPPGARLANGYRDYDEHSLRIIRFIDLAQGLGFTLREIATHLHAPEDDARKARLQSRLEAKLAELDFHMEKVKVRRALISDLIQEARDARSGQKIS